MSRETSWDKKVLRMVEIGDLKGGIVTEGNMRNNEVGYLLICVPNGKRYMLLGDNTRMPCREVV